MSDRDLQPYRDVDSPPKGGSRRGSGIGLVIGAVAVTLMAVLVLVNYDRHVSVDLLLNDVQLRLVWALLIPALLGLGIGILVGLTLRR